MIISPPFLVARNDAETDGEYVARCMPDTLVHVRDTNTPEGSFPLSFNLGWHGGLHLQAPIDGQTYVNVRAIADGEIVYARRPTPQNDNPSPGEPRNYNPYGDSPAWTDDGCVVIRHRTQVGADAQGQAVGVEFLSIYEHLSALRGPALQAANGGQERRVWRKEEIGVAGQVYGREHQLHFEIVCDDDNLQRLINRRTGDLITGGDGRSDVVFGDLYFRLPAGTEVFSAQPLDNNPVAHNRPPGTPASQPAVPLMAAQTTQEVLYVGLRYAAGDGPVNQRGHAYIATFREDGTPVGDALSDPEAEYNLYTRAITISQSYAQGHRPAPSAVYELLRFGRVIDTAHETINPADVPHWRRIRTPDGEGWVNLNAMGIRKFSDADFPHWKGWKLIDDDTDADSRCESAMLARMIEDPNNADGNLTRNELLQRLGLSDVRDKLRRTICKFPTELNQATIRERWGWLVGDPEFNLSQEDFDEFAAHAQALAIPWNSAWLPSAHWHFEPREFIAIWRKCSYLSLNELASTFPRYLFYTSTGNPRTAITTNDQIYTLTRAQATNRISSHVASLNACIRKYIGPSKRRISIFLAQVLLETAQWRNLGGTRRLMHEWSFGQYSSANPATQYYSAFYGRGIMQLTWAGNYKLYGDYRALPEHNGAYIERLQNISPRITQTSLHYSANPSDGGLQMLWSPRYDPDIVGESPHESCDSGGFYWVSKSFSEGTNINRVADRDYSASNIGLVNRLVNGGGNGYYERQAYSAYMFRILTDQTENDQLVDIVPPSPKSIVRANMAAPE